MKKLVYITLALLVSSFVVEAQTLTENYVKTTAYQVETTDGIVMDDQKIENVTYYDGLGRPEQSVVQRAGGNREDLITPVYYDAIGRTPKSWLPLAVTNNPDGEFYTTTTGPGVQQEIKDFYRNKFPDDFYQGSGFIPDYDNPYSQQVLEASPLSRVQKQAAPGFDWHATYSNHSVEFEYQTNIASEVYKFSVAFLDDDYTPELKYDGYFEAGQLFKSVIKDENWTSTDGIYGISYQFTNKLGQTVLKRKSVADPNRGTQDPNFHDTYYIYDDLGNLTYVLSPEGSNKIVVSGALANNHQDILNDLCYQYKYDYKNRLTDKHIPGRDGWDVILYDKLDRPVLTQDPNMKENGKRWVFIKYDVLGRVAYTGILVNYTRTLLSNTLKTSSLPFYETQRNTPFTAPDGTVMYYGNDAFPQSDIEIHTIKYYSDYVDYSGVALPTSVLGQLVTINTLGLPTVSKVRVLDVNPVQWTTSLIAYDDEGRRIYAESRNSYLNSRDIVKTKLDFTGKVLENETQHFKDGNPAIITKNYFQYDHMGRLLSHKQKIANEPVQLIANNHYDELGQLTQKNVGGTTMLSGYTDLEDVDISSDGTITKISNASSWPAKAKTKGVIPSDFDGGIDLIVSQNDKDVRIGLVESANNSSTNDYYDYGIFLSSNNNYYYIVGGTTYSGTGLPYVAGDLFRVERAGNNIKFYHNNDPAFHVISNITQEQRDAPLIGKVSFNGAPGSVSNLNLFGSLIDKTLQAINYKYNVRGWLTDINDIENNGSLKALDKYSDLFDFRINYNKVEGNNNGTPLYNGNIAQTLWKSKNIDTQTRGYNYGYDDLNRLTEAKSYKGTVTSMTHTDTHTLSDLTYDQNGNILTLKRFGTDINNNPADLWDNLSYQYNGNQLVNVSDASIHPTYEDFGFKDGNDHIVTQNDDYLHDFNGNITKDRNKGMNNIAYNHLNLPTTVTINNGNENGTITYIYDATGLKLKKIAQIGANAAVHTEYANGYVYSDQENVGSIQLQFFTHPEGYIEPMVQNGIRSKYSVKGFDTDTGGITYSDFKYVFQYRDHLGNIRLSYSDSDLNGTIDPASEIIEESNYYPFGLKQLGYNYDVSSNGNSIAQKWKHNGVEYEQALGLNMSEMFFRMHDPAIGRWNGVDPVTHWDYSPYSAFDNNPVYWADPTGADGENYIDSFNKMDQLGGFIGWNNLSSAATNFIGGEGGLVGDPTGVGTFTNIGNGEYYNSTTGETTTDWRKAVIHTAQQTAENTLLISATPQEDIENWEKNDKKIIRNSKILDVLSNFTTLGQLKNVVRSVLKDWAESTNKNYSEDEAIAILSEIQDAATALGIVVTTGVPQIKVAAMLISVSYMSETVYLHSVNSGLADRIMEHSPNYYEKNIGSLPYVPHTGGSFGGGGASGDWWSP